MKPEKIHNARQLYQIIMDYLYPVYERESDSIASILLEEYWGLTKTDLVLNNPLQIKNHERRFLEDIISRLLNHEPIQYILGKALFLGREFHVTPDVLIPRPETEELVLLVKKVNPFIHPSILDIGTGSGCIAISLALEIPGSNLTACDNSMKALKVAHENAARFSQTINFAEIDIFNMPEQFKKYDIIVSNPPYVPESEKEHMPKNVLDFEPADAIFVKDRDLLVYYRQIIESSKDLLEFKGMVFFEINETLGDRVTYLLKEKGFIAHIKKDIHNKNRFVYGIRK